MTIANRTPRLWVARHAPPTKTAICYGQTDVEVGVAHDVAAARLFETYGGDAPVRVWSSPFSRCRAPAEHLAALFSAPLSVESALSEMHFGDWEGRPWEAIATSDAAAHDAWMQNWQTSAPPNGETPSAIEARVRTWFLGLGGDETHILVAHSGVVRALRVIAHGRTWPDAMTERVQHLAWADFPLGPHH